MSRICGARIPVQHGHNGATQALLSNVRQTCDNLERRAHAWTFMARIGSAHNDEQRDEIKIDTMEKLMLAQVLGITPVLCLQL
jgi:hypothetical protein